MNEHPWVASYPDGVTWNAERPQDDDRALLDDTVRQWPDGPAIGFMERLLPDFEQRIYLPQKIGACVEQCDKLGTGRWHRGRHPPHSDRRARPLSDDRRHGPEPCAASACAAKAPGRGRNLVQSLAGGRAQEPGDGIPAQDADDQRGNRQSTRLQRCRELPTCICELDREAHVRLSPSDPHRSLTSTSLQSPTAKESHP